MRRALLALAVCGTSAFGQPGTLMDPTRPPSVDTEALGAPAAQPGPRLQSVLISPSRRVAVIDGSAVGVGGKVGDATVASISEGAVVLNFPGRRSETLQLITAVDKKERRPAAEAVRGKGTSQ
jgi:MSHA biogenesis protein MshK